MAMNLARPFPKFGDFPKPVEEFAPSAQTFFEDAIMAPARRICADLAGKNIPAAELTDRQKAALYTVAGFMKLENGRLVSIRPVGITDDGNGKYILAIAPEK